MAKRVFDSYHAPDEETQGVKDALDQAGITWFETHKGRWWMGSAGIWVKDSALYHEAREVIDVFQQQWLKQGQAQTSPPPSIGRILIALITIGLLLFLLSFGFWIN